MKHSSRAYTAELENYRIALDVNTSAIGLVTYLLEKDEEGKLVPKDLYHIDVQIFGEPIAEAKTGKLKKAQRRETRLLRRQVQRSRQRLKKIAHLFPLVGESSQSVKSVQGDRVHEWRALAASQKIKIAEFMAVLLVIAKNRGYYGSLKKEDSKVKGYIDSLKEEMNKHACSTVGELLYKRKQDSVKEDVILPWKKLLEEGTYADRDLIKEEFRVLWDEQEKHHKILQSSAKDIPEMEESYQRFFSADLVKSIEKRKAVEDIYVKDLFYLAIFDQRPIWWDTATIGKCPLEQDQLRAPKAHPVFQEFRIEKLLNDLRLYKARRELRPEEKDAIRELLDKQQELSANPAYKALGIKNDRFTHDRRAYTQDGECKFLGNKTKCKLNKLEKEFGIALTEEARCLFIETMADIDDITVFLQDNWAETRFEDLFSCYTKEEREHVKQFVNMLLANDKLDTLTNMSFDRGRANYSAEAMKKLLPLIKEGMPEHEAKREIYENTKEPDNLKYVGDSVVQRSLAETKKAISYAVRKHRGHPPTQIVIELSREMKMSQKKRQEIEGANKQRKKARDKAKSELPEGKQTENNIRKYLLWIQQKFLCPYCGNPIEEGSITSESTEIDHIIPKAYGGQNNMANLVLAHRHCNQVKGAHLPLEAFDDARKNALRKCSEIMEKTTLPEPYKDIYKKEMKQRAKILLTENTELLEGGFKLRQNAETAWIGRELLSYIKNEFNMEGEDRVYISKGRLTGYLRREYGLETLLADIRKAEGKPVFDRTGAIMPDRGKHSCGAWHDASNDVNKTFDKRSDHRHHVVDAAVIGLVDRKRFKEATSYYSKNGKLKGFVTSSTDILAGKIRNILGERLQDYVVWHKQDHYPTGKFFDENIYGSVFKDGKHVLTIRKKLKKFITEKKHGFEDVKKALENIVGKNIREHVINEFIRRYNEGDTSSNLKEKAKHALCGKDNMDGIFFPAGTKNKVKQVKVYHVVTKGPGSYNVEYDKAKIESNNAQPKYILNNNGYACVELHTNEKGEYCRMVFIPLHKYWSRAYQDKIKKDTVTRVYKNDIIRYTEPKQQEQYYVVTKLPASLKELHCIHTTEGVHSTKDSDKKYIKIGKTKLKNITIINNRGEITDNNNNE